MTMGGVLTKCHKRILRKISVQGLLRQGGQESQSPGLGSGAAKSFRLAVASVRGRGERLHYGGRRGSEAGWQEPGQG